MYQKALARIKALKGETILAILVCTLFIGAVPWINFFAPESGTVDRGANFHVMFSGVMAFGCGFLLMGITFFACLRTFWNYAFHNDDKDDPDKERASFKEDWQEIHPSCRLKVFVVTFSWVLTLAIYCLKP